MPANRYATRLNSFRVNAAEYWPGKNGKVTTLDVLERAAKVKNLTAVDFNYPDHLDGHQESEVKQKLDDLGIVLNGFAMRYYGNPAYKIGAFTNPDDKVRREAIDLTKRGIDCMARMGGNLMTLWMGQDGFDYSFQANYARIWDHTIDAMREIADHNRSIDISIEYKPNEPRSFSLMPDVATTLLAIKDIDRKNTGVTLDFAHVLYADEMPAFAATLINKHSRLLGVHINDGYGKRDDGLMVGSVHPQQTIELLYVLGQIGYGAALYFDTFPDITGLDPIAECSTNISTVEAMTSIVQKLQENPALAQAILKQDAVTSQSIVQKAMYGG